ncbi:PREDICTED: RB-associated KRAB zinc finger protein-like [Acropora digitifera]|uniref:RB-associated KRAB zinc finger protein-like n=1 Tax=Acropora digitifera TaxID=70779 RepID=UPI00077AD67D|nr:PREDICTED: RB-associated KRAB zinc finger protein-like [Acropora digitifera]
MLSSEKDMDIADGKFKGGKEENMLNVAPESQKDSVGSQRSFTRLGSPYAYHDTQQDLLSYERLQYQCFSTRSVRVPNDSLVRYHEPAFLVTPMYHYYNLPRIFPYFARQTAHSSQGSMRTQGFKCNYCGKVYCRKYVLKIHMRTHTGFKPLRCKVCDKSFSDPSNMKKHVKLHESEDTIHKCRYCGRNFVRYRGLLNHIKSKHSGHISINNTM